MGGGGSLMILHPLNIYDGSDYDLDYDCDSRSDSGDSPVPVRLRANPVYASPLPSSAEVNPSLAVATPLPTSPPKRPYYHPRLP